MTAIHPRLLGAAAALSCLLTGCGESEELRFGCEDGNSFARADLAGIWHLHVFFEAANQFPAAVTIGGQDRDLAAQLFGRDAEVTVSDAQMVIDSRFEAGGGELRRRTLTSCQLEADGTLNGRYDSCKQPQGAKEDCVSATVRGRKLEPLAESQASNVTLLSEYGGQAPGGWSESGGITINVRVHRGMAYLARYGDGLRIVDLADPTRPAERGHSPVVAASERYNDVKVATGPDGRIYALMASNARGAVVVDVTDPDAPTEVTTFPPASEAPGGVPETHTLFIEDARAYLAYNYDNSLRIYDIADPANPVFLGRFIDERLGTEGGFLHDLYIEGGRAYLNYWNLGMVIVDTLADPANPNLLGVYDNYGHNTSHSNWVTHVAGKTVAVHGDEEYGAHVRLVDVDPQSPGFLSTLASYQTREQVSVHNVVAHEDLAFVTYYQDGLRILDLSDPANPELVGHFHTWPGPGPNYGHSFYEGAIGVDYDPATDTIYVADTHRGLFVLKYLR